MILRIRSDLNKITSKLEKGSENAMLILSSQVLQDSNYYIPKRDGFLETSSLIHSRLEDGELVWNTIYARRLYWNPQYNFSKDVNPNAKGLWFEHAKSEHIRQWEDVVKRCYL